MKLRGFPTENLPEVSHVNNPKGTIVGGFTPRVGRIVSVPGLPGPPGISLFWRDNWDSEAVYAANDLVEYLGTVYICTTNGTTTEPWLDAVSWSIFAAKGAQGDEGPPGAQGPPGPVGTTAWADLTGRPSTFTPSTHGHATSDVTGLDAALTAKAVDTAVVHKSGDETVGGNKSFTGVVDFNQITYTKELSVSPTSGPGNTAAVVIDNDNGQVWQLTNNSGGSFAFTDHTNGKNAISVQTNPVNDALVINSEVNVGAVLDMQNNKITNVTDPTSAQDAANKQWVENRLASLVASAPTALDTLDELAAALGDDPNFATTMTTALGNKADKATTITAGTGLSGGGSLAANSTLAVAYGTTAGTACQGNDSRLSDARTPLSHSHVATDITGLTKSSVGLGNVDNTSDATKNSATATLGNKTLTSPKINQVNDPTTGLKVLGISAAASSVNFITFQANVAGSSPQIQAEGSDANVSITYLPKGSGTFKIFTATGQTPTVEASGADANHDLNLMSKGTGAVKANGMAVVVGSDNGTSAKITVWKGTAAQYAAIGTKDANTVYVVT